MEKELFKRMYTLLIIASLTGIACVTFLMAVIITGLRLMPAFLITLTAFAILWTMFQKTAEKTYEEETRNLKRQFNSRKESR